MVCSVYKLEFNFFFSSSVYICVCNGIFSSLVMEPISVPQSEQHGEDSKSLLNGNSEIRGES